MTEEDSGATLDTSEDRQAHNGPQEVTMPSRGPRTLTSTKEKAKALQECHDNPLAGHFGARRTLEKLQRRYTWKGMRKDVEAYCKDCLICKRSTPIRHKPYGLLAPLPPPDNA